MRGKVIDDACRVLDEEVADKSGLGGIAVKAAYGLVKGIKPGFIRQAVDHLLDEFLDAMDPFVTEAKSKEMKAGALILSDRSRMANALLAVTDRRLEGAESGAVRKTYEKLRPAAQKHVEAAAPRVAGLLDNTELRRTDARGISMADAIRRSGGQPARLKQARFDAGRLLGYVEAHIEQGPVLEEENVAVGIVTGIAGQSRFQFSFTGRAGHAGTTPMRLRRDALCAAAEFILGVEEFAERKAGLVTTVGQIQAEPNVSNVIPGTVILTLDVRHQTDSARRAAGAQLQRLARQTASSRHLKVAAQLVQQTASVACSPKLSGLLERAAKKHLPQIVRLPSGAGHDAVILARITPAAMLLIRCKGGISHHPDESASRQDVRVALAVLNDFLRLSASEYGRL